MSAEVCTLLDNLCSHIEPDAQCVMSSDTTYCAIKSSKHGYLAEDVSISMASDTEAEITLQFILNSPILFPYAVFPLKGSLVFALQDLSGTREADPEVRVQ